MFQDRPCRYVWYFYVGTLGKDMNDLSNAEKFKIEVLGASWNSNTNGETTYYVANRGGLSINRVTMGCGDFGIPQVKVFQNGNDIDIYITTNAWAVIAIRSTKLIANTNQQQSVYERSPSGSDITPAVKPVLITDTDGNIAIGDLATHGYKFAVAGSMIAESVTVKLKSAWPDYVFKSDYKPASLDDVEEYIKANSHLPNIPTAEEVVKEGISLGEMNAKLLKKIEEITLYLIEQSKDIKELKLSNEHLHSELDKMKKK